MENNVKKSPYLEKIWTDFLLNFASVNYVLFVTGSENLERMRGAVSEVWRREKVGSFNAPPPNNLRYKLVRI